MPNMGPVLSLFVCVTAYAHRYLQPSQLPPWVCDTRTNEASLKTGECYSFVHHFQG